MRILFDLSGWLENGCVFLFADQPIRKYGEQEKDPGTKSEGEEDSQQGTIKKILGRTPNHLTLRYGITTHMFNQRTKMSAFQLKMRCNND